MKNDLDEKTPDTSRGVRNTHTSDLIACVDWFSCTFFDAQKWEEICGVLQIDPSNFEVREGGINGYRMSAVWNHIGIYFEPSNENMGIFLSLSGQGCREFETTFEENDWSWSDFFEYVIGFRTNITRLDLALDDFKGRFTLKQIENKIKTGCVASPFKTSRNFEEHSLVDGATLGQTIYFGKTDVVIRFYDKYKERINHGYAIDQELTFWQRTEVQLRHDRAEMAIKLMASHPQDLGMFIKGILKRYVDFKVKGTDTNKSRWKTARWWERFLGEAEKIHLTQIAPDKTILRTKDWIDNQTSGSIAMLHEALGEDQLFLDYLVALGKTKMSDEQKKLAEEFQMDIGKRIALKEEMRDFVNNEKIVGLEEKRIKKMSAKSAKFNRQDD